MNKTTTISDISNKTELKKLQICNFSTKRVYYFIILATFLFEWEAFKIRSFFYKFSTISSTICKINGYTISQIDIQLKCILSKLHSISSQKF